MRRPLRWLLAALALAVATLLLAAALAVEGQPLVPARADITPADVERALAFARAHDPRFAPPGRLRLAAVSERDADLLLHHAAQHWLAAATRVTLAPGAARVQASVELPPLPGAPGGRWLNVDLRLRQAGPLPEVDALRVGRLPLPAPLVMPLLRRLAAWRGLPAESVDIAGFVRAVQLQRGRALVAYAYPADARERLLGALLPPAQRERMRAYAAALARLTEPPPAGGSVSLAALLPPLFRLAAERSAAGGDAADENRAVIATLVLYTNRRALDLVMPAALDGLPARPLTVTLAARDDFPRHFLVSAALAAEADSPLADAVGLWKELDDARRGSGFSFNDIAADRAGTRFGELALQAPRRLQARIAAGLQEADFMPAVDDLPEFLPEPVFVARYGGVGAPAYRRQMAVIEARVAALALLQ